MWLMMIMYDKFKKSVVTHFKQIYEVWKNYNKFKLVCALLEMRLR
jgi:uncharacterized phage-like protein YoqJ